MLKSLYKSSKRFEKASQCWLCGHIEEFLIHLASMGYAKETLRNNAYVLLHFGLYTQRCGASNFSELPNWIELFLKPCKNKYSKLTKLSIVRHFICYLQETGTMPKVVTEELAVPFSNELSDYIDFVEACCGLHQTTVAHIKSYCCKFLQYVYDSGIRELRLLKKDVICDFIISEGKRYARVKMRDHCLALRKFLSHLYSAEITTVDFSSIVITPKEYKHERCPRFLTRTEVSSILSTVDRRSKLGKRDYAMMLLLATYGLRGIEVCNLKLDDVDWNGNKIYIRKRKAGNNSVYPLVPLAGNAILAYLKVRPRSCHRQLFLTYPAPHKPLCTTTLIGVIKKHLRLVNLDSKGAGAYIFRYSCAQRLFEADSPLKLIGDYLGHRDLYTTRRYLKIDLSHLREVALDIEEDHYES